MKNLDCFVNDGELFLYLDGEINADRKRAIEGHLSACPDCAQKLEIEQHIKSSIHDNCANSKAPVALREKIISSLYDNSLEFEQGFWYRIRILMAGKPLVPIAAVAVLMIIFFGAVMFRPAVPGSVALINGAIQEHYEHVQSPSTLGIISDSLAEVLQWLSSKTGKQVKIPNHPLMTNVVGACTENGPHGNISCVFFDYDTRRISFIISTDSFEDIPGYESKIMNNVEFHHGNNTGINFVTWKKNEMSHILVGNFSPDTLMELAGQMSNVNNIVASSY